jgi:hypothetical protein
VAHVERPRLLESLNTAAQADRFVLRTASELAGSRRRVRLAGAAASADAVTNSSRLLARSLMVLGCKHGFIRWT